MNPTNAMQQLVMSTDLPAASERLHVTILPVDQTSAKQAFLKFLTPQRVISMHAPRYRKGDELGSLIRATVAAKCAEIEVERGQATPP